MALGRCRLHVHVHGERVCARRERAIELSIETVEGIGQDDVNHDGEGDREIGAYHDHPFTQLK